MVIDTEGEQPAGGTVKPVSRQIKDHPTITTAFLIYGVFLFLKLRLAKTATRPTRPTATNPLSKLALDPGKTGLSFWFPRLSAW